ncbi:MAG TPA: glycosyltransferase family 2 protein, partial [Phormidium sp.]
MFQQIRAAQPSRLLVVADGPRNAEEVQLCQEARAVTEQIDWSCEVLRNYSDVNLGCRNRVASGLDWAFAQVEEAIILEDDCLPHPDFFDFCRTLLNYYRNDNRVWVISGNNFQNGHWRGDGSYYFSRYNHCWGWATWSRAWQHLDEDLSTWPKLRDSNLLGSILEDPVELRYWHNIFEKLYTENKPDTWDYRWTYTCWINNGLTVLP